MVGYPGASPSTMANNIATPLERQFMQIPGLEVITSKSQQGNTSLTLQFNLNKSIDAAATDVQTAISQATGNLPVDLPSPPTLSKTNPNDQPILYIALTSDSVTAAKVYDYASTQVGERLSILPGVSRVAIFGTKGAIRIKANPSAMAIRGIAIDDLASAIQSGTSYQGAGQLDGADRTLLLQPHGQLETAEDYNNLIVAWQNGAPVYLKDVAEAHDTIQDERIDMRFWVRGHTAPTSTVVIAVYRQAGANAVEVSKAARGLLPIVTAELPPSIAITPIYDRSRSIVDSVNDVRLTLLIAFVLVVVVIFLFLGRAKDTLIPVVALPLSLLLTFIVMWALDYSLDNLSLMAMTLAIGFLVDDAIVFLENAVRRMEQFGEDPLTATLHGASEISFTILAMTISLAAVFLPLVLMPGLVGRIFREFAVCIIVAIFASGLVSLTLTPLMCSRLLDARNKGHRETMIERVSGAIEHYILGGYGRSLSWFLRMRFVSLLIWVACLVGTVVLLVRIPKSFLPIGDSGFVWGVFIGQDSSSPQQMRNFQLQGEKVLQSNPNVGMTFTMTGNANFLSANTGLVLAFLKERKEREPIMNVVGELTGGLMSRIPGILAFLRPFPVLEISTGATNTNQGQYAFALSGVNPQEVYDTSQKLMAKLNEFDGFVKPISSDFFNNTPNLDIEILRDQAATYNVSVAKIENLLRNAYSQNYLYLIKKPTDQYQVILEAADKDRELPDNLKLLYLRSNDGKNLVPLSAVVKLKQSLGPQAVNHLNQFTSVTIFFNLKPGVAIGDATDFITNAAKQIVPITIRGSLQGEAETFSDTIGSLIILMLVAVFVMYVILGILYESYLHPLTVLSSLPVALVGGFGDTDDLRAGGVSLRLCRHVHAHGNREEKRDYDRRFRPAAHRQGRLCREGDSRREHGSFPPNPDDHAGRPHGRAAAGPGHRQRRRLAPAPGIGHRRRPDCLPVHHPLHHAGNLSVSRRLPGEGARPHVILPFHPHDSRPRRNGHAKVPPRGRWEWKRGASCGQVGAGDELRDSFQCSVFSFQRESLATCPDGN